MKYLMVNSSIAGTKTKILMDEVNSRLTAKTDASDAVQRVELKEKTMVFSDGRHFEDYTGDTAEVIAQVMAADVLIFGVPTYQASVPASLKNLFDLLPKAAFKHKTVSFVVTAGSSKHYLVMEYQLKPILAFMKANIVSNYVFAEDRDFSSGELVNDEVRYRLDTLVDDTVSLAESYSEVYQKAQDSFDF